ncbi:hypothetical protein FGO68_gene13668 [Halteria grandinella]|uniref:Uncharacterized protein n=1 Tax=Halteria grandinella TaxID=5974 RepID=A0A8J8T4F9_HALGN|nr:hypothetical protein FGO68_gene13668 [Halteria grandinella]
MPSRLLVAYLTIIIFYDFHILLYIFMLQRIILFLLSPRPSLRLQFLQLIDKFVPSQSQVDCFFHQQLFQDSDFPFAMQAISL